MLVEARGALRRQLQVEALALVVVPGADDGEGQPAGDAGQRLLAGGDAGLLVEEGGEVMRGQRAHRLVGVAFAERRQQAFHPGALGGGKVHRHQPVQVRQRRVVAQVLQGQEQVGDDVAVAGLQLGQARSELVVQRGGGRGLPGLFDGGGQLGGGGGAVEALSGGGEAGGFAGRGDEGRALQTGAGGQDEEGGEEAREARHGGTQYGSGGRLKGGGGRGVSCP